MLVKKLLKTPGVQFDFKYGTENSVCYKFSRHYQRDVEAQNMRKSLWLSFGQVCAWKEVERQGFVLTIIVILLSILAGRCNIFSWNLNK